MVNAAVVGLGIGMAHCAAYLNNPRSRLSAVCDLDPVRLGTAGGTFEQGSMPGLKNLFPPNQLGLSWEKLGVKTYDSLEALLANPLIDAVSLCTPDYTHPDLAVRILEAGKHLLLEKPVALRLEDCPRIERAAEQSKRVFALGYEFRINPAIKKVKELVDSGFIGRPEAFSLYHYRTPFRRDKWNGWIQKKEFSGGLIVEETCHWFDLARYITGLEVDSLHCVTVDDIHDDFDFEDIAYINGGFEGGGILQISHCLTGFDFSLTIQVHGRLGSVWCGLKDAEACSLDGFETSWTGIVVWGPMNGSVGDARCLKYGKDASEPENIRDYVDHFIDCVATGQKPLAGYSDGKASLALALAAGRSASSGMVEKCRRREGEKS
jgi:predicted dehydrogenase